MGRKLRHVLVFLLIILKEPSMPEAACRNKCKPHSCSCSGMRLTSIPQDLPKTISDLDLAYSIITTVSQSDLLRYRNVIKVDLAFNRITTIQPGSFANLPRLLQLILYKNQIRMIQPGAFDNLLELKILNLGKNRITTVQVGKFENLPRLQELSLFQNRITTIQPGTFANLPEIQKLYLYSNQITTIQPGSFVNLPGLQELYLSRNQIKMIQAGSFANLPGLQELYLSNNQLIMIQTGTLANLPQLQALSLSYNNITMIQAGTFENLPLLQRLYLNNNQLTKIQSGTFVNLPRLQQLYLSRNQIKMIQAGSFKNLPELQRLFLSHNQITMIESHAFANMPKLRDLDLRFNKMSFIPPFGYGLLTSVPTVKLGGNPWQCDCHMAPFRLIHAFNDQIICAKPAKFQGQKLKDINPEELMCEGPTTSTPHVDAQNTFASTAMSKSSSFRKTETNPGPTAHAVGSTLPIQTQAPFISSAVSVSSFGDTESPPGPREKPLGSTFPPFPSATPQKVKTAATMAFPFPTTGTSSILFPANKPEITRYGSHESSPSFSLPVLIGSVCGAAALSIVAAVLITIWCKRNTKNPPSGPTSNIALSNINTTATVPTSGSLHDQTGQGQSLASTQPLNIKHPSRVRGPPNPKTPKGLPPLRDDDEPTYVEPDGAHYMTPEDVLYEMPANSHCEDDNRHYYQPLKKEQNLPTDASGYVLVVPNNPKGQC
ncbi:uncharacterized protein LOC144916631 [Branchiostoma floridae x Branchiostoma belcheri]